MAYQNLMIVAVCCILLTSMASSRLLQRGIVKRATEDSDDTIIRQIQSDTDRIFRDSRQTNRTYELTPINDTELLTVLTEMPLELDQLRILCDLMAMDESVKLSNQTHHNISIIIREELFPRKGSTIVKELCLTYRLSEYSRSTSEIAKSLNLFYQVESELYNSPPILRNPNS